MTKLAPARNRKYTFTVSLEVDELLSLKAEAESLLLTCELASGDKRFDETADPYGDDELSSEKIQCRIDYIFRHLEIVSKQLWNESKLASEFDTGDLDAREVRETLKRWRTRGEKIDLGDGWVIPAQPNLVSGDAETRLPEVRGRPAKLDRKTRNEMDLIQASELTKFQNAKKVFEACQENPQLGDLRETLSRMLGPERFAFAEAGFTSLDPYEAQPSTVTSKYLAKHYGLSERQLQRIISKARERRTAVK